MLVLGVSAPHLRRFRHPLQFATALTALLLATHHVAGAAEARTPPESLATVGVAFASPLPHQDTDHSAPAHALLAHCPLATIAPLPFAPDGKTSSGWLPLSISVLAQSAATDPSYQVTDSDSIREHPAPQALLQIFLE